MIRSHVAPVSAETGFIVRLPQSLYQTSRWIRFDTSTSNAAARSAAASARTRGDSPPAGSPRMRRFPGPTRAAPGPTPEAARWTTHPTTRRAGIASAIAPRGSTERRRVPSSVPPKPSKNHHGTPFIAATTAVSGPRSGRSRAATASSACAFTARSTASCGPSAAGSSVAATGTDQVRSPSTIRTPCARIASSVAPRAIALTSCPARARRAARSPPTAPAP